MAPSELWLTEPESQLALAPVLSRACVGVEAPLITVEVHLAGGLPVVSIVGSINPNVLNCG